MTRPLNIAAPLVVGVMLAVSGCQLIAPYEGAASASRDAQALADQRPTDAGPPGPDAAAASQDSSADGGGFVADAMVDGSAGGDSAASDGGLLCSAGGWCWINPLPQGNRLRAIWGTPAEIYAVGEAGTMLHHDGVGWSVLPPSTSADLRGVWGSAPTDVYAVLDGSGWTALDSGTSATLEGVWGAGTGDVYAVGSEGTILRQRR